MRRREGNRSLIITVKRTREEGRERERGYNL
jgi:hypothetical protein